MNKTTYDRTKQENLGDRMAKAYPSEKPQKIPNRAARRRMSKVWQRIKMGKVNG